METRRNRKSSFNGAALFQVRKGAASYALPHHLRQLQWGRTLSSAESSGGSVASKWVALGFNGAALFQVRKVGVSGSVVNRCLYASMGPHSFKCGKFRRHTTF